MTNKRTSFFPLLCVMLFDHTSVTLTFPILTLLFFDPQSRLFSMATSQTERSMWYGLCVALPHIVNIVATPVLSALSDEFGRKKILFISTLGALLFAVTAAFGVIWGTLSLLFLGRIIQGLFSRTNPIAQAIIGDISTRENKVTYMGYLQLVISIGAFLGPIIGGYFANQFFFKQLNFSFPYFIAMFLSGISCLLTITVFQETLQTKRHIQPWREFNFQTIKRVYSSPDILSISAILLLSQLSWSTYYQFMPPILKTVLGFNAHQLGLFIGLIAFWLAMATGFGIKLLGRFLSFRQMLALSLYLVLIGLLASILFCYLHLAGHGAILIWLAAMPIAVGDVIAYSCLTALYSNAASQTEQGKAMGVCFIVVASMWSLTGMIGGVLMSIYSLLPLIIAPIGIIFAIALLHSTLGQRLSKILL